jgi:uncharacterized protein (TIGR02757 family)
VKLSEVKELLDFKFEQFNAQSFIETDPICIPHQFSKKQDIEITALLVATIAWGNRTMIINNGKKLISIMGESPYDFIMEYGKSNQKMEYNFVHRTFNLEDLHFFFSALHAIYQKYDSLEQAFYEHHDYPGVKGRIVNFRNEMLHTNHLSRSEKHISNPAKNSAAKRLNMFLRWMVRKDASGVDFGIWDSIDTADLYLPLDVHTGNVARKLNLLKRKQNDWKSLDELMVKLRKMDPKDPVKYDFALFGLGVFDKF